MSDHYPATAQELAKIRYSVASARVRLSWVGTRLKWAKKFQSAQYSSGQTYEQQKEAFFYYLRFTLEEFLLQRAGFRWLTEEERENCIPLLNTPWVKKVLMQAAEKEDVGFFTYVGKLLDRAGNAGKAKYKETKSPGKAKTIGLQTFLFEHWADEREGLPALCYLTRSGVADIYMALTGEEASDAINNQCKRLKLLSFQGAKIKTSQLKDGRWRFNKPDGTFSLWFPKALGAGA